MMSVTERAARYLDKLPPSIQGSSGSAALFEAACVLVKGFALPPKEAWPLLTAWNQTHCQPLWTESELMHKLKGAEASTRVIGYLLDGYDGIEKDPFLRWVDERAHKVRLRQGWPAFSPLSTDEIQEVARLRNLPVGAVRAACRMGFLSAAILDGHRCFVIRDGEFAQARRLDGESFILPDGRHIKAKNFPGAQGAFLGGSRLGGEGVSVLLVEGAVALVEALAAVELTDPAGGWAILAATSASSRFDRAPDLLRRLAGRCVRIVPDEDEAGLDAAAIWLAELERVGCRVDALKLPCGIKDLGPVVASPETHQETLNALFQ